MFSSFSIATGVLPGKQEPRERYRNSGRLYLVRGREAERREMADFDCFGETSTLSYLSRNLLHLPLKAEVLCLIWCGGL